MGRKHLDILIQNQCWTNKKSCDIIEVGKNADHNLC